MIVEMQDTSLESFNKIKPHLNNRENEVFNKLLELEYATNAMIAHALGWSINRVTGRVHSLRKKRVVFHSHKSNCPITKNSAHYWTTKMEDER